jgi:hypothetical protein
MTTATQSHIAIKAAAKADMDDAIRVYIEAIDRDGDDNPTPQPELCAKMRAAVERHAELEKR